MSRTNFLLVFAAAAACAFGGDKASDTRTNEVIAKLGNLGKASAMKPKASTNRDAAAVVFDGSSVRMVVAAGSTIQPGDNFDSGEIPIDFGGAEDVAIAMSATSDFSNVAILVAWAGPGEFYVPTDTIWGDTLNSPTAGVGGSRVPVYGSALRIMVVNTGKTAITIKQLSVYACIH